MIDFSYIAACGNPDPAPLLLRELPLFDKTAPSSPAKALSSAKLGTASDSLESPLSKKGVPLTQSTS